jgi:hypothetical protein
MGIRFIILERELKLNSIIDTLGLFHIKAIDQFEEMVDYVDTYRLKKTQSLQVFIDTFKILTMIALNNQFYTCRKLIDLCISLKQQLYYINNVANEVSPEHKSIIMALINK